jgi:hypothetical protein
VLKAEAVPDRATQKQYNLNQNPRKLQLRRISSLISIIMQLMNVASISPRGKWMMLEEEVSLATCVLEIDGAHCDCLVGKRKYI